MTDWVTVREAINILGMSEQTIHRYVAKGKLKSILENGCRLVYVKQHDNNMLPDIPTNFDLLFKEKDARIQQLEEQVDRLMQLLALSQKNAAGITEQNQLLLEDLRPKQRWYHRLLVWDNA